jgi:hypothetical protein
VDDVRVPTEEGHDTLCFLENARPGGVAQDHDPNQGPAPLPSRARSLK